MENNGAILSTNETPSSSEESSSLENMWMETKGKVYEARHIGQINGFSSLCADDLVNLYTERFSAAGNNEVGWLLAVRLDSDANDTVVMQLARRAHLPQHSPMYVKYRLIIYDRTKKEAKVVSNMCILGRINNRILEVMCPLDDIVSADKEILSNDVLTVGCQIKFFYGIANFEVLNWDTGIMKSKFHCFNTLELMFANKKFSDVKINISGREFEAHKAILAAASPVFLAMFESSMTEAEQNYINIDDVDEETFEEMLRYIYTGNVNNIGNVAYTLFAAADKYAIDELKNICQVELGKSLTADNAVRVLILAHLHSAVQLKEKVIKFIKIERLDVTKTEDFNSMIDSHRDLLVEMISALIIQ